jgi:hypothetical protein
VLCAAFKLVKSSVLVVVGLGMGLDIGTDADPGDAFGVDDVDAGPVGELDEVIGLVGDEHGGVHDEGGLCRAERKAGGSVAGKFGEGLAELIGCHNAVTEMADMSPVSMRIEPWTAWNSLVVGSRL